MGVEVSPHAHRPHPGLSAVSTYGSPNAITATTPAHAAGPVAVAVHCGADAFSFEEGFEYLPD